MRRCFFVLFLTLFSISSQASILSDKQECEFSSHAHSAFDATDRNYSNICGDGIVRSVLPSCNMMASGSKAPKASKKKSKGVK